VHLALQISMQILEKIENTLFLFPGAWGKKIHEKPEEKISWHCPIKIKVYF
jgi:hypothetical protein